MTLKATCRLCNEPKSIKDFGFRRDEDGDRIYNDYCEPCKHKAVKSYTDGTVKSPAKPPKKAIKVSRKNGQFERLIGGM